MKKIIDVSHHNGNINWAQVAPNINGAIIRMGYRGSSKGIIVPDRQFYYNTNEAHKYNIPISFYFFPTSISVLEAEEEADWIYNHVKGEILSFPLFLDSEKSTSNGTGRSDRLSAELRTELLNVIIMRLANYGIEAGVYASKSWFQNNLIDSKLKCPRWVAQYNSKLTYPGEYFLWQYTSSGSVPGIRGRVDVSRGPEKYREPFCNVKFGDRGNIVRWVQYQLNIRGYDLQEDGIFGKLTKDSVIDFQKKNSLIPNGIVDLKTKSALKML